MLQSTPRVFRGEDSSESFMVRLNGVGGPSTPLFVLVRAPLLEKDTMGGNAE